MNEMKDTTLKITVLGARGSVPTGAFEMREFGGATSCILVESDTQAVFLDAGSGIIDTPKLEDKEITILITHPHFDHLIGLPFFPYNGEAGRDINIYLAPRMGLSATDQIDALLSPPLWPCTFREYPASIRVHDLKLPLSIGDITVTGMEGNHPGGCTVFKLTRGKTNLVYATDYEDTEEKLPELIDFAKDTDLLFYDAQYTPEEAVRLRGFGHSTMQTGLEVMEKGNIRNIRFVHHDPRHPDTQLYAMEEPVRSERVAFARQWEVIHL